MIPPFIIAFSAQKGSLYPGRIPAFPGGNLVVLQAPPPRVRPHSYLMAGGVG